MQIRPFSSLYLYIFFHSLTGKRESLTCATHTHNVFENELEVAASLFGAGARRDWSKKRKLWVAFACWRSIKSTCLETYSKVDDNHQQSARLQVAGAKANLDIRISTEPSGPIQSAVPLSLCIIQLRL